MLGGCTPQNTLTEKHLCYINICDFCRGDNPQSKTITTEIMAGNITNVQNIVEWAKNDMVWVSKRTLNSYESDWQTGDFIFHTAGMIAKRRKKMLPIWFEKSLGYNHLEREEVLAVHNFSSNML